MSHFANCSGFSETQLTILTGLRGGVSAALSVASVILLIVTCACQSKLGVGRRDRSLKVGLFALFGVSISYLTVKCLDVTYHLHTSASSARKWCAAFGFFDQILSVTQITLLFIYTHPIVAFLWSEITRGYEHKVCCKKSCIVWGLMSTVIVLAAVIVISSFVPFVTDTYGEVLVWCWISGIDKGCNMVVVGLLEQIFLWLIYKVLICLMCIVMILTSVILFLKACPYKIRKYRNLNDRHNYKHLFSKYIFQLIILIPVFIDFSDIVYKPPIHHYNFILWIYYAVAPPISGFLVPLSFLLYIKFGYAGARPKFLINSPEREHILRSTANEPADEHGSPLIADTAFTPSDTYHTCLDRTYVDGASSYSGQAEGYSLLEGRWNMRYST